MTKRIVIDARIRPASTGRPVDRLLEYLPTLDVTNEYTIVLTPDDTWSTSAKNIHVVTTRFPMFSFNPLNQLLYAAQLYKLKPDLVFFTLTGQQPLGYFGKQITLTHDLTMYEFVRAGRLPLWLHQLRMIGYRLLMRSAHRRAKRIIVPSDYVKKGLARFHTFTASKITRIYEASEPPIEAKASAITGIAEPFILHVGSPLPHKNIERLVEAFESLYATNPRLRLVLAGKLEYFFSQLQKQIDASSARDGIIMPGFVTAPELKWLYEHAACYTLPSLSEGFGLPGLEAMAHGCPVTSSNTTCLPEIYGDGAYYFNPLDTTDMAAKIQEVISDKRLANKLTAAGKKRLGRYSWEAMTKEMYDVMMKASK